MVVFQRQCLKQLTKENLILKKEEKIEMELHQGQLHHEKPAAEGRDEGYGRERLTNKSTRVDYIHDLATSTGELDRAEEL